MLKKEKGGSSLFKIKASIFGLEAEESLAGYIKKGIYQIKYNYGSHLYWFLLLDRRIDIEWWASDWMENVASKVDVLAKVECICVSFI